MKRMKYNSTENNRLIGIIYVITFIISLVIFYSNMHKMAGGLELAAALFVFLSFILSCLAAIPLIILIVLFIRGKVQNFFIHLLSCILYCFIIFQLTFFSFYTLTKPESEEEYYKRKTRNSLKEIETIKSKIKSSFISKPDNSIFIKDSIAINKEIHKLIDTSAIKTSLKLHIITYSPNNEILICFVTYDKKFHNGFRYKDWKRIYSFYETFVGVKRENGISLYSLIPSWDIPKINQTVAYYDAINNLYDFEDRDGWGKTSILRKDFWENNRLLEKVSFNKEILYRFEVYDEENYKIVTRKRCSHLFINLQ